MASKREVQKLVNEARAQLRGALNTIEKLCNGLHPSSRVRMRLEACITPLDTERGILRGTHRNINEGDYDDELES